MAPAVAVQRIVVALDPSGHGIAAIEQAMAIASRLQATVRAVFVEDVDLLRIASHPAARHVSFSGASVHIDATGGEALVRAQAREIRAVLARLTEEYGLTPELTVVRGRVVDQVIAAAAQADLLLIGWSSVPRHLRDRPGSTARSIAATSRAPVLVLKRGTRILDGPVAVVFDGSAGSDRALALASALDGLRPIVVLATGAESDTDIARLTERARAATPDATFVVEPVRRATPVAVAAAAARRRCALVTIAADARLFEDGGCAAALDVFDCPVLIAR
ncbi:MAG: universal stress protein [Gemmatimonas sp.]